MQLYTMDLRLFGAMTGEEVIIGIQQLADAVNGNGFHRKNLIATNCISVSICDLRKTLRS
jgi:hypothetical protein